MQPIRDGLRPFTPLDQLHRENLIATLEEFDLAVPAAEIEPLNKAWERLPPWPDSRPGLQMLKSRFVIGPLSNGNTALLVRMAKWGRSRGTSLSGRTPLASTSLVPNRICELLRFCELSRAS